MGSNHHFPHEHLPDKNISISHSVRNEMIDIISRHHRTPFCLRKPFSAFIIMFLNKYHSREHTRT